tara:strand:- start:177 stop:659 length:483 start_codon:yes stop_codon:yes gene_type:complete
MMIYMYRKATDRVVSKRVVGRSDDTTLLGLLLLEERGRRLYRAYSYYTSLRFDDDVSLVNAACKEMCPQKSLSLSAMDALSLSLYLYAWCVFRERHVLLFPTTVNTHTHTTTPLDDDDTTTTTDTTNVVVKSLSLFFFVSFSRTFFGRRKEKREEKKSDF